MQKLIDRLEQDHDLVRTLMTYIHSNDVTFVQKRRHFDKFAALVLNHIKSEEHAVYAPSKVLKNARLQRLVQNGLQQHYLIKNSIAKMRSCTDDRIWMNDFKILSDLIDYHLDEEEGEYFPELNRGFSKEQLDSVNDHYTRLNESAGELMKFDHR